MQSINSLIVIDQIYKKSIQDVWKAITEVNLMKQWFFENIESFEPKVGFKTQFNVQSGNRNFLHLWKLVEVEPMKRIVYNWKYRGYSGDSIVTFELFEEGSKTRLRLVHEVIEKFPQDIPEFSTKSCRQGWNYFIKDRLKGFLEKNLKNQ